MRYILTCSALILTGCAKTYTLAPSDPTALVRFTTNTEENTVILHVPQTSACKGTSGELLASFGPHTLLQRGTAKPGDKSFERAVRAGEVFYILAWSQQYAITGSPGYMCSIGAKTLFEAGHTYEVAYEMANMSCRVRISELSQTGESIPIQNVQLIPATYTKDLCDR